MVWTDEELFLVAQRGYDLATQGRYDLAAAILEGLLAVSPSHDWARRALASVQLRTGRAAAALTTLKTLPPSDNGARLLRLEAHLALGAKQDAVAEFAAARASLRAADVRRYSAFLDAVRENGKQLPRPRPDK